MSDFVFSVWNANFFIGERNKFTSFPYSIGNLEIDLSTEKIPIKIRANQSLCSLTQRHFYFFQVLILKKVLYPNPYAWYIHVPVHFPFPGNCPKLSLEVWSVTHKEAKCFGCNWNEMFKVESSMLLTTSIFISTSQATECDVWIWYLCNHYNLRHLRTHTFF